MVPRYEASSTAGSPNIIDNPFDSSQSGHVPCFQMPYLVLQQQCVTGSNVLIGGVQHHRQPKQDALVLALRLH